MKQISETAANTLLAFVECYDLYGPGWPAIAAGMMDAFHVDDPEEDLEDAREELAQ